MKKKLLSMLLTVCMAITSSSGLIGVSAEDTDTTLSYTWKSSSDTPYEVRMVKLNPENNTSDGGVWFWKTSPFNSVFWTIKPYTKGNVSSIYNLPFKNSSKEVVSAKLNISNMTFSGESTTLGFYAITSGTWETNNTNEVQWETIPVSEVLNSGETTIDLTEVYKYFQEHYYSDNDMRVRFLMTSTTAISGINLSSFNSTLEVITGAQEAGAVISITSPQNGEKIEYGTSFDFSASVAGTEETPLFYIDNVQRTESPVVNNGVYTINIADELATGDHVLKVTAGGKEQSVTIHIKAAASGNITTKNYTWNRSGSVTDYQMHIAKIDSANNQSSGGVWFMESKSPINSQYFALLQYSDGGRSVVLNLPYENMNNRVISAKLNVPGLEINSTTAESNVISFYMITSGDWKVNDENNILWQKIPVTSEFIKNDGYIDLTDVYNYFGENCNDGHVRVLMTANTPFKGLNFETFTSTLDISTSDDDTRPDIQIISPENDVVAADINTIKAQITDSKEIVSVTASIDGTAVPAVNSDNIYSIETPSLTEGIHVLQITAENALGYKKIFTKTLNAVTYSVTEKTFAEQNGAVKGCATVTNYKAKAQDVTVIIASYGNDNIMENCKIQTVSVPAKKTVKIETEFMNMLAGADVRMMIWDNFTNLKSLDKVFPYTAGE